ncbi:hypothetical protein OROHE_001596 [Orobanche hederae]
MMFIISFLMIIICGYISVTFADYTKTVKIGAILDYDTRIGKEITTALKVAAQKFNKSSKYDQKVFLHFQNSAGQNPLQAVYAGVLNNTAMYVPFAAEKLVQEKKVQFIISTGAWTQTSLVASIGNRVKVPVLAFSGIAIETPPIQHQWPFLIQMVPDIKQQIKCITDIVTSFRWRKVIVIYEVDSHGSDSGAFTLLSEALSAFGVGIEHRLALPPFSSLSNPNTFVREHVVDLLSKQTRVFIVLKSSLESSILLFKEVKEMRLLQRDSAWIITDPLAGLLNSVNTSVVSSMEGALGVTANFSESGRSFHEFKRKFQKIFQSDYPNEANSEPSIFALRAYDSVGAIIKAIEKSNSSTSDSNLKNLLSTNFTGLSGRINFEAGELLQPSTLKIVNAVGKKYKEVGVWSSKFGLLNNEESPEKWFDSINWPGGLRRTPKGWSMPSEANPMRIGVPGRTAFAKFVEVTWNSSINDWSYNGFCIDIFFEVLKILERNYPFPYELVPFQGSYDELVDCVANKTFDAVVGDITILADRSSAVEFTQPFTESGLTMVVTVKSQAENKAWIFVKPFTGEMWAVTGVILLYTVLIVWLLERRINPEFDGPWWDQLNTALWFTCCSLFFAHREKVHNNYTRIVVLVWLFVVLVLTSSHTANLSSMLTVPHIIPSVTEIQWLKDTRAKIGCDGDSFVRKYLEHVLGFHPDNIINISSEYNYTKQFESGNITAAFLELPYQKAFLNHYCSGYTVAGNTSTGAGDRFGGLGFVSSYYFWLNHENNLESQSNY